MNRLWVRLSLLIAGVLMSVFFMQFLAITLDEPDHNDGERGEIASRLIDFGLFSAVVGLVGGVAIGRLVSKPIGDLAQAARRIGAGDRRLQLPERGPREIVDVTRAFNQMSADLRHAEALRRSMMADISHELRTPLTVLEGSLRAALDRLYVLDEREIAGLYVQTQHLIHLVNDLRDLALAEQDHLPLTLAQTDLAELVTSTVQSMEPLAVEKRIQLSAQTGSPLIATVDTTRIRQVLLNLLTNAIRHTPDGGMIRINLASTAGSAQISIVDSGEGLAPEQLASVFNRFYRADPSRSRETGGTGLGLSIVQALIHAHGGKVEAASAGPGKGCAFTVTVPRQPPATPALDI